MDAGGEDAVKMKESVAVHATGSVCSYTTKLAFNCATENNSKDII